MPYQGVTHRPLPLSAIPWRIAPPSPSCPASSGCPPPSPESCTVNISTGFVLSGEIIHDSKSLKDRAMNFPVENGWSERGAPESSEKVGSRPTRRYQVPVVLLSFLLFRFCARASQLVAAATYIAKDVAGGCTGAGTGDAAASERRFRCRLEE